MARPPKGEDYIVQRIADLFHYADGLDFSKLKEGDEWELRFLGTTPRLITSERDIHCAIGEFLCDVEPNIRPYVLNRLADALRQKPRKSSPDDIAKIREAHRSAGDNPTWQKVDAEYHKLTGFHLDRRALEDAGCSIRPGKRGRPKKLPRV